MKIEGHEDFVGQSNQAFNSFNLQVFPKGWT
jgi:hypothetical protein